MPSRHHAWFGNWRWVILTSCLMVGCSGDGIRVVHVSGRIWVDGKPIVPRGPMVGKVWLYPDAKKGNLGLQPAVGEVDATGAFEVFVDGQKGAPVGWYRVAVVIDERHAIGGGIRFVMKPSISPRYGSPETSGLTLEIVDKFPAEGYNLFLKK